MGITKTAWAAGGANRPGVIRPAWKEMRMSKGYWSEIVPIYDAMFVIMGSVWLAVMFGIAFMAAF
jgi:hypothetical protein